MYFLEQPEFPARHVGTYELLSFMEGRPAEVDRLAGQFAGGDPLAYRGRLSEPRSASHREALRQLSLGPSLAVAGIVGYVMDNPVSCVSMRVFHHPTLNERGVALSYAVHSAWRGRGVGALSASVAISDALPRFIEESAVKSVWAEVRPENHPSVAILRRLGLAPRYAGVGQVTVFGAGAAECLAAARARAAEPLQDKAEDEPVVAPRSA